jgi:PAS domain S-box-containing protein
MQIEEKLELRHEDKQTPLRKLIDIAPVGIFITDKDGKCTYVNEKWLKVSGRKFNEMLNMGWINAIYPDDQEKVLRAWSTAALKSIPFTLEYRLQTRSGRVTWVLGETEALFDKSGHAIAYIGTISDINKRKLAEEALQENENRYRSIIMNSPMSIHEINLEGKITSMNKVGLVMIGAENEEAVKGQPYLNVISDEDRENVEKLLVSAYAGETSNFEFKTVGPSEKIFKSCFAPITNNEGKVLSLLGITEDITERKQKEEALRENEQRLKLATASAKIGVWDLDIIHNVLRWDNQMLELYGLDRNSFDNSVEAWKNSLHPDDRLQAMEDYKAALRGERDFNVEFRVVWPDGTIKTLKGNAIVLRDIKGVARRMIGVNMDVSEEKKRLEELYLLNAYLQSAREVAEKATLMKSRFLDVAAHELRTPVTAFSLLLQLTQKQLAKGIPVEVSILTRLKIQGDRISRLVVDLLDVSRLERGVMTLDRKPTNIVSLIHECLEDFKLRKSNRNLIFSEPKNPIELNIDPIRIYQVISNLLDNASKYTPENTSIEVIIETKHNIVRVSVKDYGPGILAKHQAELFSPFSRLSDELTDKSGGLGLGLFICRSIIELHGGKIGLNSEVGLGSTFYFELPIEVV